MHFGGLQRGQIHLREGERIHLKKGKRIHLGRRTDSFGGGGLNTETPQNTPIILITQYRPLININRLLFLRCFISMFFYRPQCGLWNCVLKTIRARTYLFIWAPVYVLVCASVCTLVANGREFVSFCVLRHNLHVYTFVISQMFASIELKGIKQAWAHMQPLHGDV